MDSEELGPEKVFHNLRHNDCAHLQNKSMMSFKKIGTMWPEVYISINTKWRKSEARVKNKSMKILKENVLCPLSFVLDPSKEKSCEWKQCHAMIFKRNRSYDLKCHLTSPLSQEIIRRWTWWQDSWHKKDVFRNTFRSWTKTLESWWLC